MARITNMVMSQPMEISPSKIVNTYGLSVVGKAAGIPLGTLSRWAENDEIPGKGPMREAREMLLRNAVAKLKADGAPKKAKRARAA